MRMGRTRSAVASTVLALVAGGFSAGLAPLSGAEPDPKGLEQAYPKEIRPLVVRLCQKCHSTELPEADIDLEQFLACQADPSKPGC